MARAASRSDQAAAALIAFLARNSCTPSRRASVAADPPASSSRRAWRSRSTWRATIGSSACGFSPASNALSSTRKVPRRCRAATASVSAKTDTPSPRKASASTISASIGSPAA